MEDTKKSSTEAAGVTVEEVEAIYGAKAEPNASVDEELDGSTLKISFNNSDSGGGFSPLKSGVYGLEVFKVKFSRGLNYNRDAVENKLAITFAVLSSVSGKITDVDGKDWKSGERNLFAFFNPDKTKNTQAGLPSKMRVFAAALNGSANAAEFTGEVNGTDDLVGKLVKATVTVVSGANGQKNKIVSFEPWDGQ